MRVAPSSWSLSFVTAALFALLTTPALAEAPDGADGAKPAAPVATTSGDPSALEAESAPKAAKPCQIAIMSLQTKGLPPEQAHVPELLSDSMATEIASATSCRVITQADIMEMLDFEATKAACAEGSESCLAEIGGALGVERVIGGSLGVLGSSFKLQIKLQNVAQGRVEKRVDRTIKGDPELLDLAARNAARELFDLPPLDESAIGAKSAAAGAQDRNGDSSSTKGEATADEGGGFGMVLLGAGIVAGVVGVVVAVVGAGLFGWVEASVASPSIPHFGLPRNTLFLIDASGVGLLAAGVGLALVGTGVAVAGGMME
jgi:hypothetical protein